MKIVIATAVMTLLSGPAVAQSASTPDPAPAAASGAPQSLQGTQQGAPDDGMASAATAETGPMQQPDDQDSDQDSYRPDAGDATKPPGN